MSRALSWISLVFAAAALIAAFTSRPSGHDDAARAEIAARELHAIRDRLDGLEASVSDIESRLDERDAADGLPPATADSAAIGRRAAAIDQELRAQIVALRRDLDELREAGAAGLPESREELKSAIASAQREMMNDRFRKHHERVATQRRENLERFIAENGLSGGQADDLRRVIEEDLRTIQEAAAALRDRETPPSPTERRQLLESQREALREALGQILDEEQLGAFEKEVIAQRRAIRPPPPVPEMER